MLWGTAYQVMCRERTQMSELLNSLRINPGCRSFTIGQMPVSRQALALPVPQPDRVVKGAGRYNLSASNLTEHHGSDRGCMTFESADELARSRVPHSDRPIKTT